MYDSMVEMFKELLRRNAKRIEAPQKFKYESLRKFKQAMGNDIEWLWTSKYQNEASGQHKMLIVNQMNAMSN